MKHFLLTLLLFVSVSFYGQTCGSPRNIAATTVTATTANLSWNAPATGTPTGYQYAVTTSSSAPSSGYTSTTATSVTGVAITAGTTYYVHVKSTCSGTSSSSAATYVFNSGYCTPNTTPYYYYGITNVTLGSINNTSYDYYTGYSNYASQVANVGQGSTQTFSITLDYSGYTYNTRVWVDWNNDFDFDDSGETVYTGLSDPNTSTSILTGSFAIPSTATMGNHRVRIGTALTYTPTPCYNGSYGSFEDYTLNVTTPCNAPTNVSATAPTSTTANLSWSAPTSGSPSSYQYNVTTSSTHPADGVTTTATSVSNYSVSTSGTYYLHVRSYCSGTYSDWVSYMFTTGYCTPAPIYAYGYGITNVTLGSINNSTFTEINNYGDFSTLVANVGQGSVQTFSIAFDYNGNNSNVVVWVDWNNDLDFDDIDEAIYSGTSPGTYPISILTGNFTVPATAAMGNHRLRIGSTYYGSSITPCYTGYYGSYEDYTINVTTPCAAPTAPTAVSATTTSANVSWTAPATGTPTNYQYAVTTSINPPSSGDTASGTSVTSYSVAAGGIYYLHVRSNCSGTYSNWVTSAPFQAGGVTGDSCATAIDLSTLTSPYTSSTTNAYNNYNSSPTCYGDTGGKDLIYYMVVPAGATLTINQTYSSFDTVNYVAYGGACPGESLLSPTCNYQSSGTNSGTAIVWANTTGSEQTVYWVEDGYNFSGSFTLTWSLNIPCGLPSVVVGTATSGTTANLSWAAPTTNIPSGYQYVVTTSATQPAAGTATSATSATSITGYTITAGVTNYLHVRSTCSGVNSNWVTSAGFTGVASGDTCSTSIDLGTLTSPYTSTTATATNNYSFDCGGEGNDQVYFINVPNNVTLTMSQVESAGFDSVIRMAYGGTCPGTTEIACYDAEATDTITWTNTTGSTKKIFWVEDGYYPGGGGYTLSWSLSTDVPCATPAPTASSQTLCNGATVNNLTATGTTLKWYAAATGGTALATTTQLASGTYYVSQTLNNCEGTRAAVAVTINTTPAPTASAQSFCNGTTLSNLTAVGTGLQWYTAATGGTALAANTVLTSRTYYVSQTLNSCESTRASVVVTISTTPAPTASAQAFCSSATVANLTATGPGLKWYSTATADTPLLGNTALVSGTYYVSQTINSCEGARTSVAVTVTTTTAPTAAAQSYCNGATVSSLTATGTAVKWYTTATGGTALATTATLATGTYYVSQTLNTCESTRTSVAVTINTTTTPTASAQTYCPGATVSNLTAVGTSLQWYTAATGGTALATTATLTTRTYYVSQTLNTCESARVAIAVTINTTPAPTASAQTFCNGTTAASLTATGAALQWYTTATGGTAIASTATLATGTYYVSQTLNTCESARTSVAVTITTTTAPTAAAQTFCNGATVSNLVASGTATKWYDVATGGTALTANTTLSTGTYYVSQTLNSCESARTAVAITINTTTTAPTASAQTFCNGATVSSLTANGTAIKWYTATTGGVALTATTTLATGTYYVSQTLNSCESARVAVAVTINTTAAPTASAQTFCNGTTAASLTATGTALQWYTAATGGTAIASTAVLTTRTYYVSQTLNTCEGTRTAVAVTINTTPAPTASAQTFCVGTTVAGLTATGTAVQWYSTATGGTALATTTVLATGNYYVSQTLNTCESPRATVAVTINTTAAPTATAQTFCNGTTVASLVASGTTLQWYANATGGTALASTATLATGTYYVSQTLNTCESVRTSVAVTINTTPAPTASAQTFCNGVTVSSLTASGTDLKWYTAATGGTALVTSATLSSGTYYVSQTLNSCESTRTAVAIIINTTPAPVASAQTFCVGATVAGLTATGTAVQWYSTATGGTALATTATLATGTYYASQTLNTCEGVRTAVAVTINTTPAPTASAQTFCNGTTAGSLVASGTSLQWYATATGGTALTLTDVLVTGTYYVSQTLNTCESVRTAITVTVNPVTPAPTASAQTFCAGATLSSLTATGTALQWYTNATGGSALAGTATLATGTYYVSQTLNTCESTRTAVAVIINTTPAPTAAAQSFCNSATVANLTAIGTSVQWYTTATGGSALAPTASLATGTYYASQTLNTCEGVRVAVSVTINVTAAPTVAAQTFCNSATVADLTATGTNLQWYANATGGTALTAITSLSAGTYYVSQTLNSCEGPRAAVVVTINITLAPTASAQNFCNGTTVASLTASGTALQWYTAATGGTALAPTATLATGTYYVSQTLNSCEGPRASVAVTINTTQAPTASAQTFCFGATVTSLTATGTDVKWYAAATGGTALATTATLATGTYYVSQTLNTCESIRTAVSVTINTTAAPTASAQTFCNSATVADLTATGTNLQWYANATGGTALADTASLATGTYYVSQTLNTCESPRAAVVVTINTTLAPTASAQTFCNGTTVASLTASGTSLQWYAAATGGTALAATDTLATDTYYVSQTLNSCEGPRASVVVTITTTVAPTAEAQTYCAGATADDLVATGTDLAWYDVATGGTALADTALLATGTYYVTQTLNACESVRTAVSITINTTTAPVAVAQAFCNTATVDDLTITGTAIQWYADATGGTALADTTSLATGTYYVTETLNACESVRTAVTVTVTVATAPTASAQMYCAGATVAELTATGTALTWYANETGGTALADTEVLATGTYYVSQTVNTCESTRTAVVVTINTTIAPTAEAQTYCAGATADDLVATGTALAWYTAATGGTALADTAILATGTYYVTQTLNACESVRTAVSITINTTTAPVAVAQAFCNTATVDDLTITGTAIQWYADATGGTALADTASLATGTYYVTETLNACESVRTAVTVTVTVASVPTASAQTYCAGATVAELTATGTALTWYANETGGAALAATEVLATGTYYVSQTVNTCESTRTAVVVTINTTIAPTAEAQTYCAGATADDLVATGTALAWYDVATGGTALADTAILATGTYYVTQTLNACESIRTAVSITINTTTAPVAVAQAFCNTATVDDLTITGTAIQWYADATGGTALADTASLATGTYYVTETLNACESTRTAVTVTITVATAPTASAQMYCAGATVAELTATGTALTWYANETGGTALADTAILATGTYYVSQTVNTCESTRTAVVVTITTTPTPTGDALQTVSVTVAEDATIEDIVTTTGENIVWYASQEDVVSGTPLAAGTVLTNGTTYYATQTVNGCTSQETLAVTINVVLGVKPVVKDIFKYYPNPVDTELTIESSNLISNIEVYDLHGKLVLNVQWNKTSGKLNMSALQAASYTVRVTTGNAVKELKILKK